MNIDLDNTEINLINNKFHDNTFGHGPSFHNQIRDTQFMMQEPNQHMDFTQIAEHKMEDQMDSIMAAGQDMGNVPMDVAEDVVMQGNQPMSMF